MPAADMKQFVAALPKAELHVHLVGSASPETVLALARRHPDGGVPTEPEALRRFYAFTGFQQFLDVYARVNLLVRTGADVVTLLDGLAAQLSASRVRYAEVQVTAVRNRMAGIGFDDLAQALVDGRRLAGERHGVELGWIFDADAALGPPGAMETVAFAVGHRPEGTVALGLGGPEAGVSRAGFAPAFRAARDAGLHSVPHAGETVGPEDVWVALRELGAERIGHGIGAAADPALLAHLAARGIALDVCPTSNVCTGVVPSLREHPLPALLAAGVPVTLGTDDPGMFHTSLNDEYLLCHDQFGLGAGELAELARAGARAAFCSQATRDALLAEIDGLAQAR
jgi:aminodeoxyfutalosine deaminase